MLAQSDGRAMETFIIAAVAGIVVGILSGLLGIGGGVVMVPLFRLAFGLDAVAATATSLFTIIPTSLSGMAKHSRNKTSVAKIGVVCGLFGACMSPVGAWAANIAPAWLIMVVAAAIIVYSAATMLSKALKDGKKADGASTSNETASGQAANGGAVEGTHAAPSSDFDFAASFKFTPSLVAQVACIGLFAGFMGGFVGVGGGFVMVPLFISLLGVPARLASGTSLTAVCILAVPGAIEQAVLGNIDFAIGIAMAVGSVPGAVVGANLVKYIPERALRIFFACFLAVVAVVLVLNEVGVLA